MIAEGTLKEKMETIRLASHAATMTALHVHERAQTLLSESVFESSTVCRRLSRREQECLKWVAAGKSTSIISDILNISEKTVDAHIQSVLHKLNAQTRAHAVVRAAALGFIPLE